MSSHPDSRGRKTQLIHLGRPESGHPRPVNAPLTRASTYLYESVASMRRDEALRAAGKRTSYYGRRGTDTTFALEDALVALEGGFAGCLTTSGLAANALVFFALLQPGDHVLLSEAIYEPMRRFAEGFLDQYKIAYDYIDASGSNLAHRMRDTTRLVYIEAPGASLLEIVDLPHLVEQARANGSLVAVDNTWGAGWNYSPLRLGADISMMSATKYLSGHSDVILGAVVAAEPVWPRINRMAELMGNAASPDNAYLVLRGLRTLAVRVAAHERQADRLIAWMRNRPEVARIYFPAAPEHPGHAIWKRDFTGSGGVFSIELHGVSPEAVEAMVDRFKLFGRGTSWGGYESLARIEKLKRPVSGTPQGPVVRFSCGLEDEMELVEDLEMAFEVFAGSVG